ncbi:MAG: PEP-CTERM-box response regulator transcription factor [Acidobacteriota bacterium]|jgi:two-component system NtrC family response regulator
MISATTDAPARLLVVDDDASILSQVGLAFEKEYEVMTADGPREAWSLIQKNAPDLVTLDLALENNDPESGFSLLKRCLDFDPLMKVVLITGNDTQETAMRAVDQGAFDFFSKPLNLEELRVLLRRAQFLRRLEQENLRSGDDYEGEGKMGRLLGQSPEMQAVFDVINKVAPTDVAVLVLGESGTGKELVAKEIRRLSLRAEKPMVSISCGSIPEALLESELFGHERGAFTSAHVARPGRLELADGGTVFLDEVGELPHALQVKLLRFLQEHEIERVGGRNVMQLDVRIIAATNRDLRAEVEAGRFREDLYYRLSVVNLKLPPLRERQEDIVYLAQYFLERFSAEFGRGRLTFSRAAREAIQYYPWPGNVRELEHHVQRTVLLAPGRVIQASDLGLGETTDRENLSLKEIRENADREAAIHALRRASGNVSKAAQDLEVSRPTLHDLLRKLHINTAEFRRKPDAANREK